MSLTQASDSENMQVKINSNSTDKQSKNGKFHPQSTVDCAQSLSLLHVSHLLLFLFHSSRIDTDLFNQEI